MEEENSLLVKLMVDDEAEDDGRELETDDESDWRLLVAVLSNIPLIIAADVVFIRVVFEFPLSILAIAFFLACFVGAFFFLRLAMEFVLDLRRNKSRGVEELADTRSETYAAISALISLAIPLSLIWINIDKLLGLLGQPDCREAGQLLAWLVPILFAYAARLPLVHYFKLERMITPLVVSSIVAFCIILALGSAMVFMGVLPGALGLSAALMSGVSMWVNVLVLASYMELYGTPKNYVKENAEDGV